MLWVEHRSQTIAKAKDLVRRAQRAGVSPAHLFRQFDGDNSGTLTMPELVSTELECDAKPLDDDDAGFVCVSCHPNRHLLRTLGTGSLHDRAQVVCAPS